MWFGVPAKIVEIEPGNTAKVDVGGVRMKVSVQLVDEVNVGDYVLIHAGIAIGKFDEEVNEDERDGENRGERDGQSHRESQADERL